MKLDHATVTTPDLDTALQFFCHIVGLTEGARPAFRFEGHWLYHDGKPVIHLVKSNSDVPPAKLASRIDHIAFRVANETEWTQLIERLQAAGLEYRLTALPDDGERQLFVAPVPGVMIEFVTAGLLSPVFKNPDAPAYYADSQYDGIDNRSPAPKAPTVIALNLSTRTVIPQT